MTTPHGEWDRDERDVLAGLEGQLEELRARHAADPPLELLRAGAAGILPEEIQDRVAQHLADSAWSRTLVAAADDDGDLLTTDDRQRLFARITKEAARTEEVARVWTWRRPAFLVPGVVAIAAIAWLTLTVRDSTPVRPAPSTVARNEPAPAPFLLAFNKPDVKLSLSALTWRGDRSTSRENRLLADLKPALDAYRRDDYASALREFAPLADRYPGTIEIPFYRGVSSLFVNDLPGAIAALSTAETINDPTFADDIAWYRAIAEQRSGHVADARARLDALCRANRQRASDACAALTQLAAAPQSAPR